MATVTVSIGRGGGERMLPLGEWRRFIRDVSDAVAAYGDDTYVNGAASVGVWDGVREASRTYVADVDAVNLDGLRERLVTLAGRYRQDAIALTIGETALVSPRVAAGRV